MLPKLKASPQFYFDMCKNKSLKEVATLYCVSVETLTKKIRELYPEFHKLVKNYTLFDKIDNEKSAYWLGYMYADGCVHDVGTTYQTSLVSCDKEHVEKFQKDICGHQKIYIDQPNYDGVDVGNTRYSCVIRNLRLGQKLIELGCVPKKSLIIKFPNENQVPNNFVRHFIRGSFDGDGSIAFNHNSCQIDFLGTYDFVNSINIFFNTNIGTGVRKIEKVSKIFRLRYYNRKDIRLIFYCLYNNHNISLDRKYKKYIRLINSFDLRDSGNKICRINNCGSKHFRDGQCEEHYIGDINADNKT